MLTFIFIYYKYPKKNLKKVAPTQSKKILSFENFDQKGKATNEARIFLLNVSTLNKVKRQISLNVGGDFYLFHWVLSTTFQLHTLILRHLYIHRNLVQRLRSLCL